MSTTAKNSLWILLAAICFGLGVLVGNTPRSRPVTTIKHSADEQPIFTPLAASLEQQKMCDEQAAKRVHEEDQFEKKFLGKGQNTIETDYTSHYDPKVNVCYVRINSIWATGMGASVIDAFEGRVYASYGSGSNNAKPAWCKIFIPGKDIQVCQSQDQFDSLVEKYFDVSN